MADPYQARSSTVVVDGVRSPVIDAGPADASEAVVFVHGNPGSGRDWQDLIQPVASFSRVIAPDMPGYGAADKPPDFDYTVAGYARHLQGLLEELGVQRAQLVLHDFGGPWGFKWAAENPDAFASATLINAGVLIGYRWHRYARIWRTPMLGEAFQATTTRMLFRQLVGRENPKLPPDALDRLYEQGAGWPTKRAVLRLYRATPPTYCESIAAQLSALDRPALTVWGTDDAYIGIDQADRLREMFPSIRTEKLEGHGHWVFWEDPERVASLVVPFLKEQAGRGTAL